jgi:hypothetical protein
MNCDIAEKCLGSITMGQNQFTPQLVCFFLVYLTTVYEFQSLCSAKWEERCEFWITKLISKFLRRDCEEAHYKHWLQYPVSWPTVRNQDLRISNHSAATFGDCAEGTFCQVVISLSHNNANAVYISRLPVLRCNVTCDGHGIQRVQFVTARCHAVSSCFEVKGYVFRPQYRTSPVCYYEVLCCIFVFWIKGYV